MKPVRHPVPLSLVIEDFEAGVVLKQDSGTRNGIFGLKQDGKTVFLTTRPAVNIKIDASATVSDARGRGCFYWALVGYLYFVNDDTVYRGSYSTILTNLISAGIDRCYFYELGTYLVILDPENGEGWYITSAAPTTVNSISDGDFPSDLTRGAVVLNGRLYVMGKDGQIFASDAGDPTAWNPLNVIQANYAPDAGVALAAHHKHVVAFGANTIEYLSDVGNPTGSPLQKRQDVFHEVGMASEDTLWTDNNTTFFVGVSRTGGLSVYLMAGFELTQISTAAIDSFLTTAYSQESLHFHASGAVVGGRVFYLLTVYRENPTTGNVDPLTTLVFNALQSLHTWGTWDLMHTGITGGPLVDWTITTGSVETTGILSNGDLVTFQDDFLPQDLTLAFGVYATGVYEPGVYVVSGGTGPAIELEAIFGAQDFGTRNEKRHDSVRITGNTTATSQTFDIYVTDEANGAWRLAGTIDLSHEEERVNRIGSFRQRNMKLVGSPSERVELTGLESEVQRLNS